MERNPELYKPTRRDNAYHSAPYEWWYFDGVYDNGYAMWTFWGCGEPGVPTRSEARFVAVCIADPDGRVIAAMPIFPLSETSASTETCDAKWGDNYIRGEYPRWEVHFRSGETGFDLVYENLTQGVREPPDGCYVGRIQEPPTVYYFTEVMHPRSRITGKLIVGGKEIRVKGEGYSDHQWGNLNLPQAIEYWYWGRIHLPNLTLAYFDGEHAEKFGHQRFKHMWVIKGEKVIDYLHDGIYMEASDIVLDPFTRITYPRKLVQTIDSSRIRGTVTHRMKHFVVPLRPTGVSPVGRPMSYYAWVCDCDAKLEVDGEKVEATRQNIHERVVYW